MIIKCYNTSYSTLGYDNDSGRFKEYPTEAEYEEDQEDFNKYFDKVVANLDNEETECNKTYRN